VFFGKILDQGAGGMAVAIDGAEHDVRPPDTVLQPAASIVHVSVVIVEDPPAVFDKPAVERLHPRDAPHHQNPLAAKIEGGAVRVALANAFHDPDGDPATGLKKPLLRFSPRGGLVR